MVDKRIYIIWFQT